MKLSDVQLEKELVFMPVDGTKNIKPVVSIITGKEEELPIILIDSDDAGNEKKKSLSKNLYKDNEEKLLSVIDFIHREIELPEIEDIMKKKILKIIKNLKKV